MARFHLRFKSFKPETLAATEELFAAKPWREDEAFKQAAGQKWLDAVCATYELPPVRFVLGEFEESDLNERIDRSGNFEQDPLAYNPGEEDVPSEPESELLRRKQFKIPAWSLFQLFKHFRIYMLDNGFERANPRRSKKDDVHGWACSLFYKVRPVMFRARVRDGRIKRIHPDELLTQETLLARREQERTGRVAEVREEIAQEANAEFEDIDEAQIDATNEVDAFVANLAVHSQLAGEDVKSMNTRPLRKYATGVGLVNAWDRNKESILGELGVNADLVNEAQRQIAQPVGASQNDVSVPQ